MGDKVTWTRRVTVGVVYQCSGEPRFNITFNLSARVPCLCLYATPPMSDTLLTDLHVQYIQNLGKVSGSVFEGGQSSLFSPLNAPARWGGRRIKMT